MTTTPVSIKLGEREFHIACAPEERDGLLQAAAFINDRIRQVREGSKSLRFEQSIVLATIAITHEFLDMDASRQSQESVTRETLARLRQRLETAMEQLPPPL